MKRVLGGFHHRVACRITGWQPLKGWYGGQVYTPLEDAMAEAGFQEMETYVSLHQNTVAKYIATRPIQDLILGAKRRPGPRVEIQWREHFHTGH